MIHPKRLNRAMARGILHYPALTMKISIFNCDGYSSKWDRAERYSVYFFIFLAVITGFYYVHAFGVNLFWLDEWDTLPVMFEQYDAGTLTAAEFWELHNEHRVVFPKLVMLGLGLLTNGNTVANMYFIEVLLLAILAVFIAAFQKQFTRGPAIWLMALIAFLVFSLRQYENMLWGFQVGFVMVVAASLGAFLGLSRITIERYVSMFICAIFAATVATYSSVQGLLVWPVGLGQLLILSLTKKLKIILMTIWTIIGAGEWLVYFLDWVIPKYHPRLGFSWEYLMTLIGSSLTGNQTAALVAGIIVFISAATTVGIVLIRRQLSVQSFWLATMAFSSAALGATTVGRSGFGASVAMMSRYTTFSIPLVVATCVILASQEGTKMIRICTSSMCAVLLGLSVIGTGMSFAIGLKVGEQVSEFRKWQQLVICTIDSQPDELIAVFPTPDVPRKYAAVLKRLKYNVFADPDLCARCRLPDPSLPVLTISTKCGIDGVAVMAHGGFVKILGWAVDWPARDVAGGVTVVIDGTTHQACYGLCNNNAVKNLKSDKYLISGFVCFVPAGEVRPGIHTISLKVLSRDNKAIFNVPEHFSFELR